MKHNLRFLIPMFSLLTAFGFLFLAARPATAQANTNAQALFDAVNELRTEQNLAAYTANPILMEVAQNHSRYQASLGTWTHIGSGGTTVLQRAQAAGYGIGATIVCAENVTFGYQMSAAQAIVIWSGEVDRGNLLSSDYVDTGVGAYTADNGNVFYTLMVCAIDSATASPTQTPAGEIVWGVSTTTPEPDGAIYHIVQEGQALESIARAYGVNVTELRALNNLQVNQGLFIGDVLLIRPAHTPTPTVEIPPTPTPMSIRATSTLRPTRTPSTPKPSAMVSTRTPLPTETPDPMGWVRSKEFGNSLLGLVILSAAAGMGLIVYGFMLRRK